MTQGRKDRQGKEKWDRKQQSGWQQQDMDCQDGKQLQGVGVTAQGAEAGTMRMESDGENHRNESRQQAVSATVSSVETETVRMESTGENHRNEDQLQAVGATVQGAETETVRMESDGETQRDPMTQWHMGGLSSIEEDLKDWWDITRFAREITLNTKPLVVDMVITKAGGSRTITNEIGKFFRRHNILEYKSEKDELGIEELMKVQAYACLYQSYGSGDGRIDIDDITVTIFREAKPVGLFRELSERNGFRVTKKYSGVYLIEGRLTFPTQVIVGRELDAKKHRWIRLVTDKVTEKEMREAILYADGVRDKRERNLLDSILDTVMSANRKVIEAIKESKDMYEVLRDIFMPEIEKVQRETTQRVQREADAKIQLVERNADRKIQLVERETARRVQREADRQIQLVERNADKKIQLVERDADRKIQNQIRLAVKSLRRFHVSDEDIKETLMGDYGLSEEDALANLT